MESRPAISYVDERAAVACSRCEDGAAAVRARRDAFCAACFVRFVRGKQRKHMMHEKYKVRYGGAAARLGPQRVMLAFSGGVSSVVLLDVMASLLKEQHEAHGHRQGFELVLLYLSDGNTAKTEETGAAVRALLAQYSPVPIRYITACLDSFVADEQAMHHISLSEQFSCRAFTAANNGTVRLAGLLAQCATRSAAEDLLTIVRDELVLRTAYAENCATVLYGHCMTRLANEVIALTVKGRGAHIHGAIANRTVAFRDRSIDIVFPLRDIMAAEVQVYAQLLLLDRYVASQAERKSAVKRNWTIRDLVTDYFQQLDATGYASTASTVIKTGEKLGAPPGATERGSHPGECEVCGAQIYLDLQKWLKRITVNEPAPLAQDSEHANYNRHNAAVPATATPVPLATDTEIGLCYGCLVTMGRTAPEDRFVWPARARHDEHNDEHDDEHHNEHHNEHHKEHNDEQDILAEYVLRD